MADGGKKPSNYDEVVDAKMQKKINEAYKNASRIGPDTPPPKRLGPPRPKMETPDPRESVRKSGFTTEMEGEKKAALDFILNKYSTIDLPLYQEICSLFLTIFSPVKAIIGTK